jgi:transcriptional regulator with XRE-family HTH domain
VSKVKAFQKNFGEVLKHHRQALGISQEELADRCGLHRTYISLLERGLKSASLKALLALGVALKTPPHSLVKEAEKSTDG